MRNEALHGPHISQSQLGAFSMVVGKRSSVAASKSAKKTQPKSSSTSRNVPKPKSASWNFDSAALEALRRAEAVIEFDLNGNVCAVNDNFLTIMGYSIGEVEGRHHSMFVDPAYSSTFEYGVLGRAESRRDNRI